MKQRIIKHYIIQKNIIFNEKEKHYQTGVVQTDWVDVWKCDDIYQAKYHVQRLMESNHYYNWPERIDHIEYRIVEEQVVSRFKIKQTITQKRR